MDNLAITYRLIADILSFETPYHQLEKTLSQSSFNWDAVVVEGSKHLVLPAIYCRLKAKQLIHVLPEELNIYLEEITSINRNRNKAIINQVYSISRLLNKHNINHTFLKGSALLFFGCFADNAERMIGDIDILVSTNHIDKAYNLLKKNNYTPVSQTFGNDFFEHKHLPRLKPKNHICAVELHKKLFISYNSNRLKYENILNEKKCYDSIYIPSHKHLLIHNILNFQINDKGSLYNSISLRSCYDTVSLQRTYSDNISWYKSNMYRRYFNLSSLFFDDIKMTTNASTNFHTSFYIFKLKHLKFYKVWNNLLTTSNLIPIFTKRLSFFIMNKSYRKALIKDRERVFKHFKSIFKRF